MAVLRIAMAPKVKNHQWFTSSFPLSVAPLHANSRWFGSTHFQFFHTNWACWIQSGSISIPENPTVRTSGFYQLAGRIWHGRRKWGNKKGRMSFFFFFLDSQWAQVKCLSPVGQFGHKVQETPADVFSFFLCLWICPTPKATKAFPLHLTRNPFNQTQPR